MKKIILTMTSLFVLFSAASHADLTNYYVKQEQAQKQTKINTESSQQQQFKTAVLNVDSHVTNN